MGLTPAGRAVVDASVVIAMMNQEEPSHAEATQMAEAHVELVMHTVNLAEVLAGVEATEWPDLLDTMDGHGFTFHHTTAQELATAKRATGLKMPDACVIALARSQGAEAVLTLDRKVRQAARAEGFALT
jgi:predicted nucleic acid-binding protein